MKKRSRAPSPVDEDEREWRTLKRIQKDVDFLSFLQSQGEEYEDLQVLLQLDIVDALDNLDAESEEETDNDDDCYSSEEESDDGTCCSAVKNGIDDVSEEQSDIDSTCCSQNHFRPKSWDGALAKIDGMTDDQFRKMFRLTRPAFDIVLGRIGKKISTVPRRGANCIPPKIKLASTLRWLGGDSYHHIDRDFTLPVPFYSPRGVLWPTIDAISEAFTINLPFDMNAPIYSKRLAEIDAGYTRISQNRMHGCVGAIDGWVVRTRCPRKSETCNQMAFRNEFNSCFGITVLAACDDKCRFTYFNAERPGDCDDAFVWDTCSLKYLIDDNKLPEGYYFVGDEEIPGSEQVLVPYTADGEGGETELPADKKLLNDTHALLHDTIKRAFKMLVRRFGIFWRPLEVSASKWPLLVDVCMKLHNIAVDAGDVCLTENDIPTLEPHHGALRPSDSMNALSNKDVSPIYSDDEEEPAEDFSLRRRLCKKISSQGGLQMGSKLIRRENSVRCNVRLPFEKELL